MPTVSSEMQRDESPGTKNENSWDALTKVTMTTAMVTMSTGFGLKNPQVRAAAFGLLAFHGVENSLKDYKNGDCTGAAAHALTAAGTALWSGGTAADSRILKTAGPAINSITHLISAGVIFSHGEEGWRRKLVGAAEMLSFSLAGHTESHVASAVAFGCLTVGFLSEIKDDKAFLGHALGALSLAAGAGMKMESLQSLGAGVVAAAELSRLWCQFPQKAPQAPSSGLPLQQAELTHLPVVPQHLPAPENHWLAQAVSQFTAPTPPSVPEDSGVRSTPSRHSTGEIWRPAAAEAARRHSV
ncbi:hypothetical protein [Streptomyces sp. IB2014 016-6]|uniref:hypothetical protein n=1 Tax=Streptomyces sp. IB2014 016-6 TaxID=2517818 RepID=UPI0011CADE4C|nr:hypothetical protein [Streptomyces sp. IB2014 016-6]TXL83880.1 hypothetical protein EW053_36115 [Streptomyces sp. IB2014 016-6]